MAKPSIIARDDTLLGACHAIGEDFGFNPLYLRILFAVGILWSPAVAFAAYAALAALVAFSRWMVPDPPAAEEAGQTEPEGACVEPRQALPLAA